MIVLISRIAENNHVNLEHPAYQNIFPSVLPHCNKKPENPTRNVELPVTIPKTPTKGFSKAIAKAKPTTTIPAKN